MSRPRLPDGVLTDREREVKALKDLGLTNKTIGQILVIELVTVKMHVRHILSKKAAPAREKFYAAILKTRLAQVRGE